MKHTLDRKMVGDVIPTKHYATKGRRAPRGIRRHNRRVISDARRGTAGIRCGMNYSGVPKSAGPSGGPVFEDLRPSKELDFNDCPHSACESMNVDTFIMMRSTRAGGQVKACKCTKGHVFKPGERAPQPTIPWTR